jgi:predicted transposase/invertase (TIGR01784 family)
MSYLESEKMKYDYENVLEYAVEQATEKGLEEGLAKGREEGEAKGIAEKARSVAVNMLADGLATELVTKYTGLSEAEIKALKIS